MLFQNISIYIKTFFIFFLCILKLEKINLFFLAIANLLKNSTKIQFDTFFVLVRYGLHTSHQLKQNFLHQ